MAHHRLASMPAQTTPISSHQGRRHAGRYRNRPTRIATMTDTPAHTYASWRPAAGSIGLAAVTAEPRPRYHQVARADPLITQAFASVRSDPGIGHFPGNLRGSGQHRRIGRDAGSA